MKHPTTAPAMDDFDPKTFTKKVLREARSGFIATLKRDGSGDPYCSPVDVATAADGSPLLLISTFALHTKNLLADPRVSLALVERKEGAPLAIGRIMLQGTIARTDDPADRRRYLERHRGENGEPGAEQFAAFDDFAFYKMKVTDAHYVAGFGRIGNLKAKDILTRVKDATDVVESEPSVIAHMNEDHADICRLYATKLLGAPDGAWRCVGCDPEGIELQLNRLALRLALPRRARTPLTLRKALIRLSKKAHAV